MNSKHIFSLAIINRDNTLIAHFIYYLRVASPAATSRVFNFVTHLFATNALSIANEGNYLPSELAIPRAPRVCSSRTLRCYLLGGEANFFIATTLLCHLRVVGPELSL